MRENLRKSEKAKFSLYLPRHIKTAIEKEASTFGVSQNMVILQAIRSFLKKERNNLT